MEKDKKVINEDYKIWKKNTPLLYNIVFTYALDWPSPTVEWLPDRKEQPGNDYLVQTMILGTHAPENETNYLMPAKVQLLLENSEINALYNYDVGAEFWRSESANGKVNIIQKIRHERQVNRARYMPQKSFIIATKTVRQEVYVFDYRKHSDKPTSNGGSFNPDLRLRGHSIGGYGYRGAHSNTDWLQNALHGPPEMLFFHDGHTSAVIDFSWNVILQICQLTTSTRDDSRKGSKSHVLEWASCIVLKSCQHE